MKFKFITVLILTTAAITTTTSAIQAQLPRRQGFPAGEQIPLNSQDLNLTEAQKDELKAVQDEMQASINAILTDEQRNTLKQAVEAGMNDSEAIQSINWSDEQKQKLRELMVSQRQKISEILTPEQQQKLRQYFRGKHNINSPYAEFSSLERYKS
ncbi:MAG: Spy/CpxP family protein refolding chaperone [Cyanobacteria bacterium P01_G01_bin.49]